ncbi:nuclear transport factor 2 family protein [Baaleninema simplex]|uniref:nuclear transport factor 2 family protein n=1 Tax=Baaleninema simplex TaxID=2862350 RepID=UPI001C555333|nr:nuclear transport factor 2 family protein [Baaleninema simplex]
MSNTAIEIVQKWYATHDRSLIDSECVWEIAEGFPNGGKYITEKEIFEDFFPGLLQNFEDFVAEVDSIFDAIDMIVALGYYRGHTRANHSRINLPFVHLWKIKNNKIVWLKNFTDTLVLYRILHEEEQIKTR